MTERQIIVVSEVAPRLRAYEKEAAKDFLREYASYENRLTIGEGKMQMKRCIEPADLDTLLQSSDPLRDFSVIRELPAEGPQRERVRVEMQSPIAPTNLAREMREDGEEEEAEGVPVVLYLSNAHIEAMLLQELSPYNENESVAILREIKMPRDAAYQDIVAATTYVRKWKDSMRWCSRFLPREKTLVKHFLAGVYPRRLAYAIENEEIKKINKCMNTFIVKYREGVSARRTLNLLEDAPKEHPREDKRVKPDAKGDPKGEPKADAKPQPPKPPTNPAEAKPKDDNWKTKKQCFYCGKMGHIQPECPSKKGG